MCEACIETSRSLLTCTCSIVRLQARLRVHSTHNKIVGEAARSRSCGRCGPAHPRRVCGVKSSVYTTLRVFIADAANPKWFATLVLPRSVRWAVTSRLSPPDPRSDSDGAQDDSTVVIAFCSEGGRRLDEGLGGRDGERGEEPIIISVILKIPNLSTAPSEWSLISVCIFKWVKP